jgi:hypothetical protein
MPRRKRGNTGITAKRSAKTKKQKREILESLAKQLQVERLRRREERSLLQTVKKEARKKRLQLQKRIKQLEKRVKLKEQKSKKREKQIDNYFKGWRKKRQTHEVFQDDRVYNKLERLWKQSKYRELDKILYQLAKQYGLKAKDVFSMWMSPK